MNTDWLADLAPERVPVPPGWWPPAPGWWISALLALTAVAAFIMWWRQPHRRLRRTALAQLRRLRAREPDLLAAASGIQDLLRRYALALFGHDQVARLSGKAWLDFLELRGGESLAGPVGQALLAASYRGKLGEQDSHDRDAWFAAAESFVRRAAQPERQKGAP